MRKTWALVIAAAMAAASLTACSSSKPAETAAPETDLANWVKTQGGSQTVAISYDSRLKSDVFAKTAAGVLAKSTASKAVFSQNRGSTPVCRSKPVTAAIRAAILSFPQRAVRAHFTRRSANRLPANGPFSLPRRCSATLPG